MLYNHRDCALWAENAQQAYEMLHMQKRPQSLNLSQLAAADDDDRECERVPGSPPDPVYGSERGQHRFLLEFHCSSGGGDTNTPSPPELMEREPLLFED